MIFRMVCPSFSVTHGKGITDLITAVLRFQSIIFATHASVQQFPLPLVFSFAFF
jgi:hypothetical protein